MELNSVKAKNYTKADIGDFAKLIADSTAEKSAKQFLRDTLGLTGMEVSITAYPPNYTLPFFHSHKQNEELYIVLKGEGQMKLDDEVFDVCEGSMIRVLPTAARNLKAGPHSELVFLCIQAKEGSLEQCNRADGVKEDCYWN